MTWEVFLRELAEQLRNKGAPWQVEWFPNKSGSQGPEVLVGLGEPEGTPETKHPKQGAALQPQGSGYRSVASLVRNTGEERVATWRSDLDSPQSLSDCRFVTVVEDLSPDTCLGFLFFLARLLGVSGSELPDSWAKYADSWEAGDVHTTGAPYHSWGCLHSSLGHSFFTVDAFSHSLSSPMIVEIDSGLLTCLRFLTDLLRWEIDPSAIPERLPSVEHARARWHLKQEEMAYRQSLEQAIRLQLRLPLGDNRRYAIVDAYLATETQPSGAKKAFLRRDQEHTWLGEGFAFMGIYRPNAKGTGNEMTISIDPATGIHLGDLWRRLEEREDSAWQQAGEVRPCDTPRNLKSYPDGGPNEPWWDDYGNFSLLAAPRRLPDGRSGTRLQWKEDVLETIWAVYNPALMLRVTPLNHPKGPSRHLHEVPTLAEAANKQLVIAQWNPTTGGDFVASPTVQRYMAACSIKHQAKAIQLAELPAPGSFKFLCLPGAMVTVHRDGTLILDDWTDERLDLESCQDEFERVTERINCFNESYRRIEDQLEAIQAVISGGSRSGFVAIINQLSQIKTELRVRLVATESRAGDSHVATFRKTLEEWWAVGERLEDLNEAVAQLESLIQNHLEVRTNRLISGLTVYGFPAILLGGFVELIFQEVGGAGHWWGVNWTLLLLYLGLVAVGAVILHLGVKKLFSSGQFPRSGSGRFKRDKKS